MYKVADFNSLWEIGFAINAIFVYFELQPFLEERFIGMRSIGKEVIDRFILEKHRYNIQISGLRGLGFGYAIWVWRLKYVSIINSLVAVILIIISGYIPKAEFGTFLSTLIIIIMFAPILAITAIILFGLPMVKIEGIENAINRIITANKDSHELNEDNVQTYRAVVEYIKFMYSPFLYLFKKNKSMSIEDVINIIHNDEGKDG